jgi:hypothetical protein
VVAVSLLFGIFVGKVREVVVSGAATLGKKKFFIKLLLLHLYNYYNGR